MRTSQPPKRRPRGSDLKPPISRCPVEVHSIRLHWFLSMRNIYSVSAKHSSLVPSPQMPCRPSWVAVLAVLLLVCLSSVCKAQDPAESRLAYAKKTKASSYPSYVAISTRSGYFICGGTLIAKNIVLTASHCLSGVKKVTAGPLTLKRGWVSGGTTVSIAKIFGHPKYSKKDYSNDIALLELSKPLSGFKLAKLATSSPKVASKLTVVGHGETERAEVSSDLLVASMIVRAGSYCEGTDPGAICLEARRVKNGYMEVCSGDSGGPGYVSSGVVSGVVSYGPDQKCGRNPWSVFADVSYYSDWIKSTMSRIAKGGGGGTNPPAGDEDYEDYEDYDEEESSGGSSSGEDYEDYEDYDK